MESEETTFDIRDLLDKAVCLAQDKARAKGLDFKINVDTRVPVFLQGSETYLTRLLQGLLERSVELVPAGNIEIRVRGEKDGDKGVVLLFNIVENPPSALARELNPEGFVLAVAEKLIAKLRGTLLFQSGLTEGSLFFFDVHLRFDPMQEKSLEVVHVFKSFDGVRVLVADDSTINQLMLEKILEKHKCTVSTATDGEEALKLVQKNTYDVVFMDCQMPKLDGFEATQKLRVWEGERGIHTPVIAITANAMTGDKEACFEAGMDDYVQKPYTFENIEALLEKWASTK